MSDFQTKKKEYISTLIKAICAYVNWHGLWIPDDEATIDFNKFAFSLRDMGTVIVHRKEPIGNTLTEPVTCGVKETKSNEEHFVISSVWVSPWVSPTDFYLHGITHGGCGEKVQVHSEDLTEQQLEQVLFLLTNKKYSDD